MGQRAIRNWISRHSYHSVKPTVKNKKLQNRVPDIATLGREIAAWQAPRNRHQTRINWGFSTTDARVKLKRLYPSVSEGVHQPVTELRRAA